MADMAVSAEVHLRDEFGRFIAACDAAATKSVLDAAEEGARLSRRLAPSGPPRKDYGRRPKLKRSISARLLSSRSARWEADTGHALPQEFGAGAHTIRGNPYLSFMVDGKQVVVRSVHHPGNRAQPYLRPAYAAVSRLIPGILRRNYPG